MTSIWEIRLWESPVREVAKRYRISDVALAKICKKMNIPRPPRGYWARQKAGYEDKREPLPLLRLRDSAEHKLSRTTDEDVPLGEEAQRDLAREQEEAFLVTVDKRLSKPHPLVDQARVLIRDQLKKDDSLVQEIHACLDIRVSPKTLPRALRIADALVKALELRGYPIVVTKPKKSYERWSNNRIEPSKTYVEIHETRVQFHIEELTDTVRPEPKAGNDRWYTEYRPYKRVHNGRLSLKITNWRADRIRKTWSDGKKQSVEDCLGKFIIGLISIAEKERLHKIEREREEREWQEQERRREEARKAREHQERMVQDLERRASVWAKVRMIRSFLDAVEASAETSSIELESGSPSREWMDWARDYADGMERRVVMDVLEGKIEMSTTGLFSP